MTSSTSPVTKPAKVSDVPAVLLQPNQSSCGLRRRGTVAGLEHANKFVARGDT